MCRRAAGIIWLSAHALRGKEGGGAGREREGGRHGHTANRWPPTLSSLAAHSHMSLPAQCLGLSVC